MIGVEFDRGVAEVEKSPPILNHHFRNHGIDQIALLVRSDRRNPRNLRRRVETQGHASPKGPSSRIPALPRARSPLPDRTRPRAASGGGRLISGPIGSCMTDGLLA